MLEENITMPTPRERRLANEFKRIQSIRKKEGLIDFRCADLTAEEASAFLATSMTFDVITEALPGFLEVEEYVRRFPDRPPEKYLVIFRCTGLRKDAGQFVKTDRHLLEIVFGLDYPTKRPRFVWLTDIWHPNIDPPYLCTDGRPFAIGTTLDQICLMVGQMIQYRNYNVEDPLNKRAAQWAIQNRDQLPVDTRGLLDGRVNSRPLVSFSGPDLIEWTDAPSAAERAPTDPDGPVVQWL